MNNAGFESGLVDWTLFTDTESITDDAFSGSNALALTDNGAGVDQSFSVIAGETYTLNTYGKTTASEWSGVGLRFYDAQWNELGSAGAQVNSANWAEYTVDAIAPTGAVNGILWAWKGGDTGTTTLDEFGVSGATPPPPPTTGELLSNPGFESGLTRWDVFSNTETITEVNAFEGSQSLALTTSDSGANQAVAILEGESYQFSLYAQTTLDSGQWVGSGVDIYDENWNRIDSLSTRIDSTTWNQYDIEVAAGVNAAYALPWFYQSGDNGTTLIDQVSFQAIEGNPGLPSFDAIAHWSFDQPPGNNQTDDISALGSNHPGTLINGVVSDDIGGSLGGIVTFDGQDDYIAVADTTDINLGTHAKRTVTAWFKVENKTIFLPNAEDERKQVIYEEGGYGRGLNIYIENGLLYVGGWNENENDWSGTYLSTDQIESNTWHHVALVLDAEPNVTTLQAGALSAYIDGTKFGEGEGSQLWNHVGDIGLGAVNVDTQFHDGDLRGTGLELFAGDLADVKVYNRALSGSEIADQVEAIADEIDALNFQPSLASERIVSGLDAPEAIDWIPNTQTMLIVEKAGVIKVLQDGTLLDTPFIDISDQVNNDKFTTRGITDIAIHPDFEQNPYVYLFYAYDPPEVYDNPDHPQAGPDESGVRGARVVRITADATTNYTTAVPNSEVVVLGKNSTWDNYDGFVTPFGADSPIRNNPSGVFADGSNLQDFIAVESNFHNTGAIEFGPDGALYVSIGDSTTAVLDTGAYRSQDLDNLSGKVLRIDPITGEGLADNPFFDGDRDSNRSKVYQYGLRNPFRITIHPETGEIFIGDTGWKDWEEVNSGGAGVNFGWPHYEGARGGNAPTRLFEDLAQSQTFYANPTPVEAPIVALDHANDGARSVVMGDFYFGDRYPDQYQGDLFFVDSSRGIVRNISFDSSGNVAALDVFTTGSNVVAQIVEGPDDYLYFVDLNDGFIGRWIFEE